jgi:Tfp pilus assembly protein PilO
MLKIQKLVAMAALVAVAMLAAGWFLLVSPQRSKAAGYESDAAGIRANSAQLQTQLASLRQQQKGLPKVRARLAAIAAKVPNNPAEPALVRALTKAADDAGVDLTTIAPAEPTLVVAAAAVTTPATGTSTAPVAPSTVGAGGTKVATIAVKITAVGTYAGLMQFQANLEALTRSLKTTGIALAPGGSPTDTTAAVGYDGKLTASISANVYMTIEGASVAPLTGAGQPAPTK